MAKFVIVPAEELAGSCDKVKTFDTEEALNVGIAAMFNKPTRSYEPSVNEIVVGQLLRVVRRTKIVGTKLADLDVESWEGAAEKSVVVRKRSRTRS